MAGCFSLLTKLWRKEAGLVSVNEVAQHAGPAQIIGRLHPNQGLEAIDLILQRQELGCGQSGSIRLATDREGGKKFAVKTMATAGLSQEMQDFLRSEVSIQAALDHPHILRVQHVCESDDELQIVTEHMAGGDLHAQLSRRKCFSEAEAADAISQILLGVSYLHAHDIIHRDLKLENVMYKDEECTHLKLIDFGMATRWEGHGEKKPLTKRCGTPAFMSPEMWNRSYTDKADMWAVGLIAFELLTGSSPHCGRGKQYMKNVKAGNIYYGSRFQRLSHDAQDFVRSLLRYSPELRPSAAAALEHPFLAKRAEDHGAGLPHAVTQVDTSLLQGLAQLGQLSDGKRTCLSLIAVELSLEEQAALERQFHAVDADRSGSISRDEFCAAMSDGLNMDTDTAKELFSKIIASAKADEIPYRWFVASGLLANSKALTHEDACRAAFQRLGDAPIENTTEGCVADLPVVKLMRMRSRQALRRLSSASTRYSITSNPEELLQEVFYEIDGQKSYKDFLDYVSCP